MEGRTQIYYIEDREDGGTWFHAGYKKLLKKERKWVENILNRVA
jgi:hypothetical protein